MGSSWAFIGSDVLATIPGALRRDGDVNKTWLKRAEKVWNKAGGDGIDLHRSEPGAIILHASQRYFYGNNADDVMRRVFLDAIVPGSSRRNASSRATAKARTPKTRRNAQVHHPSALDGFIAMSKKNAEDAIKQIKGGQFPQYDENARQSIAESILHIVKARAEQEALGYTAPRVRIAGLTETMLPDDLTVGELRKMQRYVFGLTV